MTRVLNINYVNHIYLSGKITGAANGNLNKFNAAAKHLLQFCNEVSNPHNLPNNHNKTWASYMKVCVRYLTQCDKVVVLDDWQQSRGAIREVLIAKWLNIPVVSIETMQEVNLPFLLKIKVLLNLI